VQQLHPEVAVQLRQSFAEDPRIDQLINSEIDAWWRDLVATIDDEHNQEGWLGSVAADESGADHDLDDDLALCEGSVVSALPQREAGSELS
jgi:hypothetical protein